MLSTIVLLLPIRSAFADSYDDGSDEGCFDARRDLQGLNGHGYDESVNHGDSEFRTGYVDGYRDCWNGDYKSPQDTDGDAGNSGGSSSNSNGGDAWRLTVKLTDPPFGIENVRIKFKGHFGYEDNKNINWQEWVNAQGAESHSLSVPFDIPSNAVPIGYQYQVCAWRDVVDTLLSSNCHSFTHTYNGGETVTVSLQ
jgi:hypothetical protein